MIVILNSLELFTISMLYYINLFLRNIVSTVNLGCKLDLKTIALRARNAEYNPKVRLFLFLYNLFNTI